MIENYNFYHITFQLKYSAMHILIFLGKMIKKPAFFFFLFKNIKKYHFLICLKYIGEVYTNISFTGIFYVYLCVYMCLYSFLTTQSLKLFGKK